MSAPPSLVETKKRQRAATERATGWNALPAPLVRLLLTWIGVTAGRVARRVCGKWNAAGRHPLALPDRVLLPEWAVQRMAEPDLHWYTQEMNPVELTLLLDPRTWARVTLQTALDALVGASARDPALDRLAVVTIGTARLPDCRPKQICDALFRTDTAPDNADARGFMLPELPFEQLRTLVQHRRRLARLTVWSAVVTCTDSDLAWLPWPENRLESLSFPNCILTTIQASRPAQGDEPMDPSAITTTTTLHALRRLDAEPPLLARLIRNQRSLETLCCLEAIHRIDAPPPPWYEHAPDTESITELRLLLTVADMFKSHASDRKQPLLFPRLARLELLVITALPRNAQVSWWVDLRRFLQQGLRPLRHVDVTLPAAVWARNHCGYEHVWPHSVETLHLKRAGEVPEPEPHLCIASSNEHCCFVSFHLPQSASDTQLARLELSNWWVGVHDLLHWAEFKALRSVRLTKCRAVEPDEPGASRHGLVAYRAANLFAPAVAWPAALQVAADRATLAAAAAAGTGLFSCDVSVARSSA